MTSYNTCMVGMHFNRPYAPKIYSRNTSVWSEYEYARRAKYGYSGIATSNYSGTSTYYWRYGISVPMIDEKPLNERLPGLSSLVISKVRRIL